MLSAQCNGDREVADVAIEQCVNDPSRRPTMTADDALAVVTAALRQIAPDVSVADIDPRKLLQEETDIDSVDFINLVDAIHDGCGIEIPEHDFAQLATVEGIVAYLTSHAI